MLNLALLMPLARGAEMRLEQIIGAEGDEGAHLMAWASGFASFSQSQLDLYWLLGSSV